MKPFTGRPFDGLTDLGRVIKVVDFEADDG